MNEEEIKGYPKWNIADEFLVGDGEWDVGKHCPTCSKTLQEGGKVFYIVKDEEEKMYHKEVCQNCLGWFVE